MSRLPRHLEHLRTAFNAEAASAATCRAFAAQATADGKANLAQHWQRLAEEKDRSALQLLHAAGKIESEAANLRNAIAEGQYENEVLYPRLEQDLADMGHADAAALIARVRAQHEQHLRQLDGLRRELTAATGDVRPATVARVG
jgi:rubrerythrin